jgi:hypothetical protein
MPSAAVPANKVMVSLRLGFMATSSLFQFTGLRAIEPH